MFPMNEDAVMDEDRNDLIEILRMRFGSVPEDVLEEIQGLTDFAAVGRLIIVAANAPSLGIFREELQAGSASFRITGERFNPIAPAGKGGAPDGE
ncbi:hypothetical protein [Indiicoccus explosivorum]|uniref:hypothetical protein n=1 Tax=Indiicoccus explosivorum TaxID=1917864 RepID=UPI000B444B89|nr:hypothetical protein [Indiicoccus explosivorum]